MLQKRDISNFNSSKRPKQCMANLWSQKMCHMSDVPLWYYHALQTGNIRFTGARPSSIDGAIVDNQWPSEVLLDDLYDTYDNFRRSNEIRCKYDNVPDTQPFWAKLKEMLPKREDNYEPQQKTVRGSRLRFYPLSSLEECRRYFAENVVYTPHETVFPSEYTDTGLQL